MTNITDPMIDAGAAILDPMLSSHCPRQVARDVYAAMEEAKASMHSAVTLRPVDPSERPKPLRRFVFNESQVYEVPADRMEEMFPGQELTEASRRKWRANNGQTATSDGRW